MTQQHDKGFRSIFSNPRFFVELLKTCKHITLLDQDRERSMKMFVSNFEKDLGDYIENVARLESMEREWVQYERKWAQTEQKLVQSEQNIRQLVLAMREMGVSPEIIAQKAGLSLEAIEGMI